MNHSQAYNNLLVVNKVFNELNVTFWLDGGTCLGAYRENAFLDSDFDIDIGMLGENDNKIPQIIGGLKTQGYGHFHLKEHPCGVGKQISCIRNGISLDVFVYYLRGDKRFRVMFDESPHKTVRHFACVYPRHLFEDYEQIDFMDYGVTFNLPKPCNIYLEAQYGDYTKDKTKDEFHWQTDYKSMDETFPIYDKPNGRRKWFYTETIHGKEADGSFFRNLIKEGFKIYPIEITALRQVKDGNKRLASYKALGVPMIECYVEN